MAWFLIFIIGGPVVLIAAYSFLYAVMPQGTNPSLVLLPLVLVALLVIALVFAISLTHARRQNRAEAPGGTPAETEKEAANMRRARTGTGGGRVQV